MTISELGRTLKAIERLANSPAVRGLEVIRATERLGEMIRPTVTTQFILAPFEGIGEVLNGLTALGVLAE